jgi:hypothetical protein
MLRAAGRVNPLALGGSLMLWPLTFSGCEYTVRLDQAAKQNAAQYGKQFPCGLENSVQTIGDCFRKDAPGRTSFRQPPRFRFWSGC